MKYRALAAVTLCSALLLSLSVAQASPKPSPGQPRKTRSALRPGRLTVLPDDGRALYFQAMDAAKHDIRIEICVLEDPEILAHVQAALHRGVKVRAIVDQGKYLALPSESANLAKYFTGSGGDLHLSNPVFPRSFPKVILIDSRMLVYGSACLDQTTFMQYRDFAQVSSDPRIVRTIGSLFENDWKYSAAPGQQPSPFNPTPPIHASDLVVAPVNATTQLVGLYQQARRTLDIYTETVGNRTLEAELAAAVQRGVKVRLIAPALVNGATAEAQQQQDSSLAALAAVGVHVHVSGPDQSTQLPYMHARAAVVDGKISYLGSVSLSPDSATVNREMGMIQKLTTVAQELERQFEADFTSRTTTFAPPVPTD